MEKKQDWHFLLCHCEYAEVLPPQAKEALQALKESGISYTAVPDLCELVARKSPLLAELAGAARLAIAACHPRAVQWLFAAGDAPLCTEGVEFLNMRDASAEQILRSVHELASGAKPAEGTKELSSTSSLQHNQAATASKSGNSSAPEWMPWFPVIDYARCKNCQQCLGFCLFSVYAVGPDAKVQVKNPASCKTDCPACARVCPETAIIFPKYPNAPINGGELKEGETPLEPVKVDTESMTRGDVLNALRKRNKSSGRFLPDPDRLKAVRERLSHLSDSKLLFDIQLDAHGVRPLQKKESE